jgi:hypothetical protein
MDNLYATVKQSNTIDDMNLLHEIARETSHIWPIINTDYDQSMELYRRMMSSTTADEHNFHDMLEEFLQSIEKTVSNHATQLFDST